jgi:N-acylneuraminate cytidylyltransferase
MSVVYAEKHPCWSWKYEDDIKISPMFPGRCNLDRHDLPKPYYVDGAVYWAKTAFFEKVNGDQYEGNIGGYVMPPLRAVDVDTKNELSYCEYLLSGKKAAK